MRSARNARRTAPPLVRAAMVAALLVAAPGPAEADTFLLNSGDKVVGEVAETYTDPHRCEWMRVKTQFGSVRFPKSDLKRQLAHDRDAGTLRVTEIVVTTLRGVVEKSTGPRAPARPSATNRSCP